MNQKKIWMTEMEELLAADQQGAYCKIISATLAKNGRDLKVILDKGLSPDEYKKTEKIYQAVETAREVVEQAWNRLHTNPTP
jgi:type III secretion system YseE family protein